MPRSAIEAGLVGHRRAGGGAAGADRRLSAHVAARRHGRTRLADGADAERARENRDPAARADRPRFLALQEEHPLPPRSSGAWALHQIAEDRRLRALSAGESAGVGAALQGTADRRHELLPRSGGVGAAARRGAAGAARGASARRAVLRAWVPGCSTGEEAYSLAIVFKEALEQAEAARSNFRCRSLPPTSTGTRSTRRAQGLYPANIAADVSAERLRRFFVRRRARLPGEQGDPRDGRSSPRRT